MTAISGERAELTARLTELESADFAARFRASPLGHLRIAVRECAAQAEIYRNLGLVDASRDGVPLPQDKNARGDVTAA